MNKDKIWTKDFMIITGTNVFIALNFYMLLVIISVYAMNKFSATPSQGGLASGIFVIGALLARVLTGKWIERVGRKRSLYIGVIMGLTMMLTYFFISNLITLCIIRFCHGLSYGIASTASATIAASVVPKNRRGEGLGYFMLSVTLATAIGPFIGMVLSANGSYNLVFSVCTLTAAISFIGLLFLYVEEISLTDEDKKSMKGVKFSNFFEIKALTISMICGLLYFSYSTVFSFINAYSREIKLTATSSYFFIIIAIVIFISRPITGKVFDLKGENYIMYPGFIFFVSGMILLSQVNSGIMLLSAAALIGVGVGIIQSGGQAVSVNLAPSHRIGMANSTFFACLDFGVGAGPFILGILIPYTGYRGIYMIMGVVASTCIVLYYYLHGKNIVKIK